MKGFNDKIITKNLMPPLCISQNFIHVGFKAPAICSIYEASLLELVKGFMWRLECFYKTPFKIECEFFIKRGIFKNMIWAYLQISSKAYRLTFDGRTQRTAYKGESTISRNIENFLFMLWILAPLPWYRPVSPRWVFEGLLLQDTRPWKTETGLCWSLNIKLNKTKTTLYIKLNTTQ